MGGVYITARKPSVGQVEGLLNVYRCHRLQQLANGYTYVMAEKPYTTVIDFHSIETETCRHCIFAHQMKLQLNLMYTYSQPCQGESTSHVSTLWFTATSPKQQCVLAKKESI